MTFCQASVFGSTRAFYVGRGRCPNDSELQPRSGICQQALIRKIHRPGVLPVVIFSALRRAAFRIGDPDSDP